MKVLLTQTQPSADRLAQRLAPYQHRVCTYPLYQAESLDTPPPHTHWDVVVLLSAHAAFAVGQWSLQAKHWLTIGPSSAQALHEQGIKQVITPDVANSQGLLAHPILVANPQASILILCGEHGLNILYDALRAQGACVCAQPVYRLRSCGDSEELASFMAGGMDAVCIASLMAARRFLQLTAKEHVPVMQWLVASKRIANALGVFNHVVDVSEYGINPEAGFLSALSGNMGQKK